jgi:hypothetical protein
MSVFLHELVIITSRTRTHFVQDIGVLIGLNL